MARPLPKTKAPASAKYHPIVVKVLASIVGHLAGGFSARGALLSAWHPAAHLRSRENRSLDRRPLKVFGTQAVGTLSRQGKGA